MPYMFGIDTGDFLDGNSRTWYGAAFNNAMDVLNVGGYAAAGLTEAMLSGSNPWEGILYGIQNRESMVEALKANDVGFATPIGIAADLLMPTLPLFSIANIGKAKQINEVMDLTRELYKGKTLSEAHGIARQVFSPELMAKTGFEAKAVASPVAAAAANWHLEDFSVDDLAKLSDKLLETNGKIKGQRFVPQNVLNDALEAGKIHDEFVGSIAKQLSFQKYLSLAESKFGVTPRMGLVSLQQRYADVAAQLRLKGIDATEIAAATKEYNASLRTGLQSTIKNRAAGSAHPLSSLISEVSSGVSNDMNKVILANERRRKFAWNMLGKRENTNAELGLANRVNELVGDVRAREAILTNRLKSGSSITGSLSGQALKANILAPVNYSLRNAAIFSGVGDEMANALDISQRVTTHMRATYASRVDEIINKIGNKDADHKLWYLASHGMAGNLTLPKHVQEAVDMTRKLMQEDIALKQSIGAQQLMSVHTSLFKRMSTRERILTMDLINDPQKLKNMELKNAAGKSTPIEEYITRFVNNIKESGASVDPVSGHVTRLMPEVSTGYLPIMFTPKHGDVAKNVLSAHAKELLLKLEGGDDVLKGMHDNDPLKAKMLKELETLADTIAMDMKDNPAEIIGGFQHQRGGKLRGPRKLSEVDRYIYNPKELLYRWAGDSGLTIGAIEGFGAKNEIFAKIRSTYLKNHGIIDELRPDNMAPDTAYGLQFLDTAFRAATGTNKSMMDKVVSAGTSLADKMFLGPRTIFVQLMNFANSAAHTGIINSFASMGETLRNKEARDLALHISGVFPNLADTSQTSTALEKILEKGNFIYGGIKRTDSFMRSQSAMAGMISALEDSKKIKKLFADGNLEGANLIINKIKQNFNTDLGYLLDAGTRIKSADLWRIGNAATAKANFSNYVTESPLWFNTPGGRFFLKFKQFAFHQTKFIWDLTGRAFNPAVKIPMAERLEAQRSLVRYLGVFGWTETHLEPVLNVFKDQKAKKKDKEEAMHKVRQMALLGAMGYMGEAAVGLTSSSEALGLGMVAGPVVSAGLKAKDFAMDLTVNPLTHITPRHPLGKWDLNKIVSDGPAIIRQGKYLWENSTR